MEPIPRPKSTQPIPSHATCVFKGAVFDVYQWQQEMYDGSVKLFDRLKRPDTVVVFGVLDDGKILLTRQEQPGKAPYIAAAGGMMDEGEDVITAARRELLEESGYTADYLKLWKSTQPVGKLEWAVYVLVAKGLKKVADMKLDGGEKITLMPVTFDELLDIGRDASFVEKEIVVDLVEAKYNPVKREELLMLFDPTLRD